jgi:UDP-glucose 4-epimerase
MQRRILVTGGAGQIGASLCNRLMRDDANFVVAVDNLSTGNARKLEAGNGRNFRFVRADVNTYGDIAPIFSSFGFDYVFHYAAVVGVQRTLANPKMVLNDIDGIRNVLDLAKNTGVRRVFFSSSSEVYGEPVETPQKEDTTPLNSRLPYAIVKNVAEAYMRTYKQEFDLDFGIFRFFNTYGPLQTADFVVPRFVQAALRGEPLRINGDGGQTRTFCYVEDNLDATVAALDTGLYTNEVVNIGSDEETSILELAKLVLEATDSKAPIVHGPALLEGDMTRRQPDVTKMKRLLGRPLVPLRAGLERTVRFFRDHWKDWN